jgi:hypothetical protein
MTDLKKRLSEKSVDYNKYPDPHRYTTNLQRALWVLCVVETELEIDRLQAKEIASFLTETIKISASAGAITVALSRARRGLVDRSKEGFKLMELGRRVLLGSSGEQPCIIIEPGKPFTTRAVLFESILFTLKGKIKICDPYCGARTLDILNKLDAKNVVLVLTQNIDDKPKGSFLRLYKDFRREMPGIEIRIYEKSELHDRYIISKDEMWLLGHGLKDIGNKESFIVRVGLDIKESIDPVFDRRWNISSPLS